MILLNYASVLAVLCLASIVEFQIEGHPEGDQVEIQNETNDVWFFLGLRSLGKKKKKKKKYYWYDDDCDDDKTY